MGGASFGNLPGNNAPAPVFGGTNPTGMIPGGYNTNNSYGFPSYNMFGATQPGGSGYVTPEANLGIYPGSSSSGVQGLNSGFGSSVGSGISGVYADLGGAYGATGNMIGDILSKGLFNPQVAAAYMNAMQPAYNQGIASQEQAFGTEGARFGSSAALGIGNFASQFDLNEQQTMANMYMQAQQEQLSLLENILPTIHSERVNNESSAWISDLLGGLEIAGGAIGAVFTGGATLGLIPAGINTIAGANSSSGSSTGASIPNIGMPNTSGMNAGANAYNYYNANKDYWNEDLESYYQSVSAGATLGGTTNQDTPNMPPIFGGSDANA